VRHPALRQKKPAYAVHLHGCCCRKRTLLGYAPFMLSESLAPPHRLGTALELHRKGLRLVPLVGKRAVMKDWPSLHLGESDIRDFSRRGLNWGIITGEPLVVLDTDNDEAEAWVNAQGIESPVMVRTGRGGLHRYFKIPEHADIHSRSAVHRIDGLDVKGWHGYVVAAGSIHPETKQRYEYLPGRDLVDLHLLPTFDPHWVREIRPEPLVKPHTTSAGAIVRGHVRDVRAYIRGIQSIEGSGGDRACFTVACLLAEAGLSFDEALSELLDWNQTNAFPAWEGKELSRKLRYAFERVLRK
jgi:Bifunctional DNA primase/polymerase, N-terminal